MSETIIGYVIGPYRAPTEASVRANIERARSYAEWFWKRGIPIICPHLNTAFMGGISADKVFLEGDLVILKRCDFAITVDGWQQSAGSKVEVITCEAWGIPVFHSFGQFEDYALTQDERWSAK